MAVTKEKFVVEKLLDLDILDNPVWNALNNHHRQLAVHAGLAARYQPDVFFAGAVAENTTAALSDLHILLDAEEAIALVGRLPDKMPGWQMLSQGKAPQMVCEDLKPAESVDAVELKTVDVHEMLELIALAEPGPFLPRTIEMGQYLGVRQDGRLVAMAGERLHPTGFCEISAVCTHPEYRGRGYASALTTMVADTIFARGEIPFLHVRPDNEGAIRIYRKLGFRCRKEIQLSILQKLG